MLSRILDWFGFSSGYGVGAHGHIHDGQGAGDHGHTHGVIDPTIATTDRGIWAIKWSFVVLALTAVLQIAIVAVSGSVALLADTIHNVADAATAIPLWIAFRLARRQPTPTFNYGYGRVEDLAGIAIVLIILFSALVAGYEAVDRILNPQAITFLGWVALAGVIGFAGNEIVAVYRIKVGREINSAALIADGYHARTDGLTSLAVVFGALGVWLGFPLADPIIGLLITLAIFAIVWQSGRSVITRMLDGIEPGLLDEVRHAAEHVPGIAKVLDVKARWIGHRLHVDLSIIVDKKLSVSEADAIRATLRSQLFAHLPALSTTNLRVQGSADEESRPMPHSHASPPIKVSSALVEGLLEIADTPDGERMLLTTTRQVAGLEASVVIERENGRIEDLGLRAVGIDGKMMSSVAPEEPHEFNARLILRSGDQRDVVSFEMREPHAH